MRKQILSILVVVLLTSMFGFSVADFTRAVARQAASPTGVEEPDASQGSASSGAAAASSSGTGSVPESGSASGSAGSSGSTSGPDAGGSVVEPNTFDLKITLVGDCLLASFKGSGTFADRVRSKGPEPFLAQVKPLFQQDDLTMVNLETVLTDRSLSAVEKDHDPAYWYKAPTSNVEILTSASVEAVALANNHVGDYGDEGRSDTKNAVTQAGLLYSDNDQTLYYEKNGYTVAFICNGLWNDYQTDAILQRLQQADARSDFQIVYFHGGTERVHETEDWKVTACHRMVDAGADLILGSHPHVLQPREVYKGVDILYSLGNFCVGDEFHPENRTLVYRLTLTITEDGQLQTKTGEMIPCYVHTGGDTNNFVPAVIEEPEVRQKVLDFMDGKADSPL